MRFDNKITVQMETVKIVRNNEFSWNVFSERRGALFFRQRAELFSFL